MANVTYPTGYVSPRQWYLRRWEALKQDRQSYYSLWQELSDHILPRRARFLNNDRNKVKRNDKIINNTPRRAQRVLASGMMAGVTSPARPWFRFTTPDLDLMESPSVRLWLWQVEERIRIVFARSNIYNGLHNVYADLGTFGTSALHVEEDSQDIIRGYNYPIGQYALQNSPRQVVDTVYREQIFTVHQLVEKFGRSRCSSEVRSMYDRGEYDTIIEVLHIIQPNKDYNPEAFGSGAMLWKSCWLELGSAVRKSASAYTVSNDLQGFLNEGGYEEFPVMCPRWGVTGEDVYGESPGMDAIGDCKALQHLERRKAQLVDKTTAPPMVGPATMLNKRVSLLAGDFNPVDNTALGMKVEPAMVVQPGSIQYVNEIITRHEERIEAAYYADLWLMLAESDRREITAREVAERHEEKMLQLGPVMERLQDELLDPLIDRTFAILLRNNNIPRPPPELEGMTLKVDYISILTQAQKLLTTTAIERTVGFAIQAAQVRPDILDNFDFDEMSRQYVDSIGLPPQVLLDKDQIQGIREERARQQQQVRANEDAQAAAGAMKDLSAAAGPDAISQLAQGMTGNSDVLQGTSGLSGMP